MENCETGDGDGRREEMKVPLLEEHTSSSKAIQLKYDYSYNQIQDSLRRRVWIKSKKLWHIVGPTIFTRTASYSLNIITQSFAGRLGNLELASISLSITVVLGFNFGLLLGMASALETFCGQAYGAKQYRMLGIYLQRSWVVLFLCAILLLPVYIFTSPILKLLGQPDDLAEQSGLVTIDVSWFFLVFHIFVNWLFNYKLGFGIIGAAVTMNISWSIIVLVLFCYVVCGSCPHIWTYFSTEAFSGLWEFFKLSSASGHRILVLITGNLNNAAVAVSALAVCMSINAWEMSIPLAFFTATGVANQLGAGNGKAAKFGSVVSAATSFIIGIVVFQAVDKLEILLNITIFINSIQHVLSAKHLKPIFSNSCYYIVGLPLGAVLGWFFHLAVRGIWSGMIGGTAVQTLVLVIITIRCDWFFAEKASLRMTAKK
ncbi:hypothetical protein MKX01_005015 [Papaver californicum]|nr:hypothetical protein MKX01_005015 [Papaver californicum]